MSGLLYKTFFRRNSTFWASIFATAFVTEMVFDSGVDKIFDRINRGVRKIYIESRVRSL